MTNALTGRNSIDQLLRTTHQHHIYLSGMADRKASFLIAAASVMLTIIIGRFAEAGVIPIALLILGGFTLVAAVLSILCIIPRSQKIPAQSQDINLLFFGEFAHLSVEEYWRRPLGNSQRCTRYVGRHLLNQTQRPVFLAMDEVERVYLIIKAQQEY